MKNQLEIKGTYMSLSKKKAKFCEFEISQNCSKSVARPIDVTSKQYQQTLTYYTLHFRKHEN